MTPTSERVRLSGWKAIASHLDVTVRTAQLWEAHHGLPVHRLSVGSRARVHAFSDELDAWLEASSETPHEGDDAATEPPAARRSAARRPRLLLPASAGIAILAIVIALTGSMWGGGVPTTCVQEAGTLTVLDAEGRKLFRRTFRGSPVTLQVLTCDVTDIDGDGEPEVLAGTTERGQELGTGRLHVFESAGDLRWTRRHGRSLRRGERRFDARFTGRWVRVATVGGRKRLVVGSVHNPFYPSEIRLLDPSTGETLDSYLHPGWLLTALVMNLDEDPDDELLVGGVNNPGDGFGVPIIAGLDLPFSGPNGERRVQTIFGTSGPRELFYYVLPRTRLADLENSNLAIRMLGRRDGARVMAKLRSPASDILYTLDLAEPSRPIVESVEPGWAQREAYARYAREGLLPGTFDEVESERLRKILVLDTAPDGNGPELAEALRKVEAGEDTAGLATLPEKRKRGPKRERAPSGAPFS